MSARPDPGRVEGKREEQGGAKHTAVAPLPGGHLDQLCRQKAIAHGERDFAELRWERILDYPGRPSVITRVHVRSRKRTRHRSRRQSPNTAGQKPQAKDSGQLPGVGESKEMDRLLGSPEGTQLSRHSQQGGTLMSQRENELLAPMARKVDSRSATSQGHNPLPG